MKIYMLRILPPLANYKKYYFESMPALLETAHNLYQSIRIDTMELTSPQYNSWQTHTFEHFLDSIQIFTIDTDVLKDAEIVFPSMQHLNEAPKEFQLIA